MTQNKGQRVVYTRVSTEDQNLARQEELTASADMPFEEKASAGEGKDRPKLRAAIDYCRAGDTFVVYSIDRLARSIIDLNSIVAELRAKGAIVSFEKEGLTFYPDKEMDPYAEVMFNMLGAFAQFERQIIRQRSKEGIAKAKIEGKYRGQKPKLTEAQADKARQLVKYRVPKAQVAKDFDISRTTLYRVLEGDYMTIEQWIDDARETKSAKRAKAALRAKETSHA